MVLAAMAFRRVQRAMVLCRHFETDAGRCWRRRHRDGRSDVSDALRAKVYVVHRRDKLRASKIMQEKAFRNEKIEFIWNTASKEILGSPEEGVNGVRLRNCKRGEEQIFPCAGVFVAIGHKPNTDCSKASWTWTRLVT
jgi:alkyl hydroperoxide reductase subunit AhpF